MTEPQSHPDSLMSVRLVVLDHYLATPNPLLDPVVSEFRGYNVRKVPILRVFGSLPTGQKCTLHIHGIFPYMYVPMPTNEDEGFIYRLASSLDKAINISMQQGKSQVQHVYKALKVTGRPMYGYHPRQHNFVKLFFYNPYMLKRAADLLVAGAVMDRVLQPHESHINLELQFMMDYNLQGMNYIHLRHVLFRQECIKDEYDEVEDFFPSKTVSKPLTPSSPSDIFQGSPGAHSPDSDPLQYYLSIPPAERFFHVVTLPPSLLLPREVLRQAVTELEVDTVAADILNTNSLGQGEGATGMNPGLTALWEDERCRRQQLGIKDPLTPPGSPPRPSKAAESSESEKFWYERYLQVVDEKKLLAGRVSPQDSADPDATINMFRPDGTVKPSTVSGKKLRESVYPSETTERELRNLPNATQLEPHILSLSQTMGDVSLSRSLSRPGSGLDLSLMSGPDDTIVDEEVIATQMAASGDTDSELLDVLADLAQEGGDLDSTLIEEGKEATQRSSRSTVKSQSSAARILAEEDEAESLEMSQVIWDSVSPQDQEEDNWNDMNKTALESLASAMNESAWDIEDL